MLFNLVLPQIFPCGKYFAAFFARVARVPRGSWIYVFFFDSVVSNKPL
jgi:hypothetical protein